MQALTFNVHPIIWLRAKLASLAIGRSAFYRSPGPLRLINADPPSMPGPGWVLCRTRLGGICGTDLAMIQLRQSADSILQGFSSMPMIPGHENVAEVVEAAPDVDPACIGRRVCVEPTLSCAPRGIDPPCSRCSLGQFGACENFGAAGLGQFALPAGTSIGYNSRTGGSWGEFFVAHQSQLVPVPDELSDEQAILTDPIACSLHAVLRADLSDANAICVYGGGILGLATVACLRAVGFSGQIHLLARHDFQKQLAIRLGASAALPEYCAEDLESLARHIGGQVVKVRFGNTMLMGGYDVLFDCVGSPASLGNSLKMTRARGQIILVGTSGPGELDTTPLWFRELTVVGTYGRQLETWQNRTLSTYQLVHEFMLAGKLPTAGLLTHLFPLPDYRHAFDAAYGKGKSHCVRAAFTYI